MTRWAAVPGYEGRYAVSDDGRVVSYVKNPDGRELAAVMQGGYWCVGLRTGDGCRKFFGIHRLMLMAFDRLPEPDEQARHLNDNRDENRLSNLAWGSRVDNSADAIRNGRNPFLNKTHCPAGHAYLSENTYLHGGHRKCATCVAARGRLYRKRTPKPRAACPDCGVAMRKDHVSKHRARRHQLVEAGKPTHGGGGE